MLWIAELNSVLLFYFLALNEGHKEAMTTDTEFSSWLQKCFKKTVKCNKLF